MTIIYTDQRSSKTRKQLAKEQAILDEQRAIRAMKTFTPMTQLRSNIIRDEGTEYKKVNSVISDAYEVYKPADKVYTGTAMIGIGQLHKSNAVPVFSQEDAIAISKMRRG